MLVSNQSIWICWVKLFMREPELQFAASGFGCLLHASIHDHRIA